MRRNRNPGRSTLRPALRLVFVLAWAFGTGGCGAAGAVPRAPAGQSDPDPLTSLELRDDLAAGTYRVGSRIIPRPRIVNTGNRPVSFVHGATPPYFSVVARKLGEIPRPEPGQAFGAGPAGWGEARVWAFPDPDRIVNLAAHTVVLQPGESYTGPEPYGELALDLPPGRYRVAIYAELSPAQRPGGQRVYLRGPEAVIEVRP